jgi:beta-galactosidase
MKRICGLWLILFCTVGLCYGQTGRKTESFNKGWKFFLGDDSLARTASYNDSKWRNLTLPHDWSIEGAFSDKNNTTQAEGGLPAGTGWYRKSFVIPASARSKLVFIDFDGIYRNSEIWINGHYLGKRPNGYISFSYELTPYLKFGKANEIAVKVDNSAQPNSRWYSGSGIYRNVWLTTVNKTYFAKWGTFITTPQISAQSAIVEVKTKLQNRVGRAVLKATIYNAQHQVVASAQQILKSADDSVAHLSLHIDRPILWSVDHPYLYKTELTICKGNTVLDNEEINTGIRSFDFDVNKGFSLNGRHLKIKGVCLHHDLGALGAAVNTYAIARELHIMKDMGCNAIRTSHNPPAPEFLELCDKMGFLVMDEAFDMWRKKKSKRDYSLDWPQWHKRDLEDQILRDRNHPSVFIWSVGNEIREQFDSTGISITRELVQIVKNLDPTRPVTSALSESDPKKNFIYKSGALDLVGLNYHQEVYADFPKNYPGQKFIATETMSALETRGFYDQPTDTTRHWPTSAKAPFKGNAEMAITAYDNVAAYWGSTHEETWKIIKKYDFLSGLFIWTGFDYLGEPSPYPWPARSSYFGIVDLAGFPKDVYYMYQSEWTDKPVLHLLPHWNWKPGEVISVWAYYSGADEVELFLNGKSLGVRKKNGDNLHVEWKVPFEAGTLKAVSRKNGEVVKTEEIHTAGKPAKIQLLTDRKYINGTGTDLCYITVKVLDQEGNMVPQANNLIHFSIDGPGSIVGLDNGYEADLESFKGNSHKVYNGLALAIIQAHTNKGTIRLKAESAGLSADQLTIQVK